MDSKTTQLPTQIPGKAALPTSTGTELGAQSVASWLTLQRLVFADPGVCTEAAMFYRKEGKIFVSALHGQIRLEPGATVRFNTAFNVLGLEALDLACHLGCLVFALRGTGQVEVSVFQGLAGRSAQRLLSDIVILDPEGEIVLNLENNGLIRREGVIWVELRTVGTESACIDSGRFLTDTTPNPDLRLAICCPQEEGAPRAKLDHLTNWAAAQGGKVTVLATPGAGHAALLTQAKAQAFTHALLISSDTTIGTETLDRTLAALQILSGPSHAFGAITLDVSEAAQLADNGLVRNAEGKLEALSTQFDMRIFTNVVDVNSEAISNSASGLIVPQSTFLAFALTGDHVLTADRLGLDDLMCLSQSGLQVSQLPGLLIRRDTFGHKVTGLLTLQNVIFPEQTICTEGNLFFHPKGAVVYDDRAACLTLEEGATAFFDSYFNALSIGKWHDSCALNGLWLGIFGRGRVEVKVFHAIPDRSWEQLATQIFNLSKGHESLIDLSHYRNNSTRGMIYFEVRALSKGVAITAGRFMTEAKVNPACRLALSITTFKREAQVENTARRLAHYLDRAEFADQIDCFIVDNGNSAEILVHPKIRRIANANLGGAGGFTRGLLEAEALGYSHVLFMDDDAAIPMEALHRTYAFLSLAVDPKAAVAGAMINNTDKWRMFENGATFDRKCFPLFTGTDLRDRDAVFRMENESALSRSSKMYGGWWFFAFPVAQVTRHPFPFFVRGDDVNFSLANEFAITTLNGVVSFADDFTDKESPLTWYLDLRSHMVHHLTLEKMEVGRRALAGIGVSFFKRNIPKFQYETIEAVFQAWEDVLKGPDFFTANADASAPRAAIKALTKGESWKPAADLDLTQKPGLFEKREGLRRRFYPLSLNGHFLPFFPLWGGRRVIPAQRRGHLDVVWGAAQLTFLNSTRDKGYVTKRSNLIAARQIAHLASLWLRTMIGYSALRALYHKRYPLITTPDFWRGALASGPTAKIPAATSPTPSAVETQQSPAHKRPA